MIGQKGRAATRVARTTVLTVALVAVPVFATAADRVVVQIGAVLATNTEVHFDTQLAGMRQQLETIFHYTSYQLMKRENRDVGWGDPVNFEILGGRFLRVMPKSLGGDRISLNVLLRQNNRVLMDTDFSVRGKGMVMVGGPRHGNGVLILWIGAQAVP